MIYLDVINRYAHDVLTSFMSSHGFSITRHHHLPTAWVATYTNGQGGRTVGVNSEMDALPGIGHACGHNLIAIAGVAIACALRDIMEKFDIEGKIVLLGTPGLHFHRIQFNFIRAYMYDGLWVYSGRRRQRER